jgi:galactose-1-phosphate uridylyltransferase
MKQVAESLARMVAAAFPLLNAIDEEKASLRPAPGEWSKKEIVGHLIDSAANNHQRFIRAQQEADLAVAPYAQERWVELNAYQDARWVELLLLWKMYNVQLARVIGRIPADKQACTCRIGEAPPVTLHFLAEDYVAHMQLHFRQLGITI